MSKEREEIAIAVENVSKIYKLYDRPRDRMLEALGLSKQKKYHEKYALSDVSFHVKKGECVGIIGTNGSGKSTLSKNLNAILTPTSGEIYINDLNTNQEENLWDIRQTAGMVFQNPDNQIVATIVEDDVAFGPENLGVEPAEIRRRVDKALHDVNMGAFKGKSPHLLSGGQKQRIAIAGVVAMKPECIIFDEPTAMLDPMGRNEIMSIIEELHGEGITVILITHFMEEAVRADRVIVMHDGEVFLDGTPHEVFSQQEKIKAVNLDVPPAVDLAVKLREKGIPLIPHRAIQMTRQDYLEYDYLIGMDTANIRNMNKIACGDSEGKIYKLLSFAGEGRDVADPWYTGDFEQTYEDATKGCQALLAYIRKEHQI